MQKVYIVVFILPALDVFKKKYFLQNVCYFYTIRMTIDSAVRLNLEQNKYDYLKYFSFFSTRFYLSLSGGYIDQVLASWKIRTELFCLLRKEMCFKVVDL